MGYILTKLSGLGWEQHLRNENEVEKLLRSWICTTCKEECGDDLEGMLSSACGCEFYLEGFDDQEDSL